MSITSTGLSLLFAGSLVASVARAGDAPPAGVDLSGTWVLNEKLSDDPREVMKERMGSMPPRGGGPGGRPPGGGGPGGGGFGGPPPGGPGGGPGGGMSEENAERMKKRMREFEPAKRIVIVSTDERITMVTAGRDTLTFVPDGQKRERKTPMGTATVEATWKDLALEVKTRGQAGHEATRLYRINPEGRLEVVSEIPMPNGGPPTRIVLRYDEAGAE